MQIRRVVGLYFSATGTTRTVVGRLAQRAGEGLGVPVGTDSFTLPENRIDDRNYVQQDLVICGTPVYAGRVPNVLLKFLHGKLHGGNALAVPVVLFGNRNYDDALIELRNILEEQGFHTVAGGAFVGEHSFSYTLGARRPDAEDLALADELADKIVRTVQTLGEAPTSPVPVKGCDPIRPYYTPRDRQGNPVNILKVKPKTHRNCVKCGICAHVCPMGSISEEDPTSVTGICIKCGACIKRCPMHAKYYDDPAYLYHQHELEEGFVRRAQSEIFVL